MGAVAAILHWSGSPIDPGDLSRMGRASAHRGPDGWRSRVAGRAAFGHSRFVTLPGDTPQPLADARRGLTFVFDGRLDNRADLIAQLEATEPISDAGLALEAVAAWGDRAPAHLVGDFAFVAWDERRRRALCARDHMGIRHLHYFSSREMLVCATDIAQVLAHPRVPREPNPAVAADYLAIDVRNGSGTLYRDVCRVPPGHLLVADASGVRLQRYWSPEPRRAIRYKRDEDYAGHCREILVRAVGAHMRSDRRVAAMLSGGVDSSSVVTVAHRLVPGGSPPQPFSMVYPGRPESDERPFIDAVVRSCGTTSVLVEPDRVTESALRGQTESFADSPSMPADGTAAGLWLEMRDRGYRVALTGAGGDFLFSGSVFQYADLLRRGRVVAALKRYADDWRADDTGRAPLGLLQAGVWPLLPGALKRALRPHARRVVGAGGDPAWLRVAREQPEPYPDRPRGGSYATEEVTRLLGSGMHAFFLETSERAAAQAGIELRSPLLDRRLVEFALDIPDDQRRRGPYTKYVLRQALAGHLAEPVRLRRTKGDFGYAIAEAIEALGGERLFGSLRIAEAGWVDPAVVLAEYRAMRRAYSAGPAAYGSYVPGLWMIAAVELWFRAAFDNQPSHTAAGAVAL